MKQLLACLMFAVFAVTCNKPSDNNARISEDKSITSFSFKIADNAALSADIEGVIETDTIRLTVPFFTVLTSLSPVITFTGKEINPASKTPQNFTTPVSYTVTAGDDSKKTYVVIVNKQADSTRQITAFEFNKADNPGLGATVSGSIGSDTIYVDVPYGTNVSSLKPSLTTNGYSISPANNMARDFTHPVTYTVTAQNGATKTYVVVVRIASINAVVFINSGYANWLGMGRLYALDANTGKLRWKYATPTPAVSSGPTFLNGIIYSAWNRQIVAFDTLTKSVKWQFWADTTVYTTPLLVNGVLFLASQMGIMYALDAATGSLKWQYQQERKTPANAFNVTSPTIVDGVVYTGNEEGYIYANDAITGSLKWRTYNASNYGAPFASSPSVVNGILYIGDIHNKFFAVDVRDGSILWEKAAYGISGSPTVVDGTVYVVSGDRLYAFDAVSGTQKWTSYLSVWGDHGGPVVADGVVYVATEGQNLGILHAIHTSDGTRKWIYTYDHGFHHPVIFNNTVYTGSYSSMFAINAATGTLKWKFVTDTQLEDVRTSLCIVDQLNNVYESSVSGKIN